MAMRWYVVNAYSNFEHKVAEGIREAAARKNLSHLFEDIVVPVERGVEVRKGRKVEVERKFFPGYVLVRMELTDDTWALVRNVPKVSGFLENNGKPSPMAERDVQQMLGRMREEAERPATPLAARFEVGDAVRVTDGPFTSFSGTVEETDLEKGRLKVSVSIFGRATNVDLDFSQVEKA